MVSATKDIKETKIACSEVSFASAEENRRNPYDWVEELRPEFMKRIKNYEDYLSKWGIIAQTGIEQEFWAVPKVEKERKVDIEQQGVDLGYFPNSPFIEKIYPDHLTDNNGYEVVVGTGNGIRKKPYPHTALEPSVIIRATEGANKLISKKAKEKDNPYNAKEIDFDPSNHGSRLYAQQVNISLWDKNLERKKPLFHEYGMNGLTECCIKKMIEAQNALVSLYTISPNVFSRFSKCDVSTYTKEKTISFSSRRLFNPSILWRPADDHISEYRWKMDPHNINKPHKKEYEYGYIEDRLGNSDMPPYVNMLITLAGAAEGVRGYVEKHNIQTASELMQKIASDKDMQNFSYKTVDDNEQYIESNYPRYYFPRTREKALTTTENSELAKNILGDDLYNKFISGYKEHCLSNGKGK